MGIGFSRESGYTGIRSKPGKIDHSIKLLIKMRMLP